MKKIPLQKEIIYGPVESRRLGSSLGINLSPCDQKECSFDCVYCQYGPTEKKTSTYREDEIPKPEEVEEELLEYFNNKNPNPDYITLSGNGEPTLHPKFPEIVRRIDKVRNSHSEAKIALLSNSSQVNDSEIIKTINLNIDRPFMKLDVGTAEKFEKVNNPHEITFKGVIEGLKDIENLYIQSIKFKGYFTNMDEDLNYWVDRLKEINPKYIHIYSLDRPTHQKLEKIRKQELEEIKNKLLKNNLKSEVF